MDPLEVSPAPNEENFFGSNNNNNNEEDEDENDNFADLIASFSADDKRRDVMRETGFTEEEYRACLKVSWRIRSVSVKFDSFQLPAKIIGESTFFVLTFQLLLLAY